MNLTRLRGTLISTGIALCIGGPASAGLTLCNQSFDVLNVAIAQPAAAGSFDSRGWWRVAPNRCVTLERAALTSRYYYVFAADVFGNAALPGATPMCVATRKFEISGQQDCLVRGFLDARFQEIDTQDQPDWTVFVTPLPAS